MSGYYDNSDCGYQNSWDYDDCYKPRHRRHHHRRYDDCWDYTSYCN